MPHTVFERVKRWALEADAFGAKAYEIFNEVEYYADRRFHEYHPTLGPRPEFRLRLRDWLNSAPDESDQKKLLELLHHIFFAGIADFNALYHTAYRGNITRWLVDEAQLDLRSSTLIRDIHAAAEETWFCPITDSMQIAAFYHINNLSGRNERPDWHSLSILGDQKKIAAYMQLNKIKRIVLLEDFVGSGSQMRRAVTFAASIPGYPILLAPMIICPAGLRVAMGLASFYSEVTFSPILSLPERGFVPAAPTPNEDAFFAAIRELASRLHPLVRGNTPADLQRKSYGPYGFAKTGALTVMYSNCPDNTLPLIHHRSSSWSPLFPRSTRV
jgi:hypothetical protein